MNLLVGSTGFIGSHLVEYLFEQNEISKGIFRKGARLKTMDLNGVQGVEADLLDHHSLHEAMEGVDTVYSMASPSPLEGRDYRINGEGIANLLDVSREAGVKTIVHLSTLDVFGFASGKVSDSSRANPARGYQASKLEAEEKLLEFSRIGEGPRIAIIRSARAVGSRDDTLVAPLLRMIQSGTVALPESRKMSFSHPKDIAAAMYTATTRQLQSGRVFMIKSFDSTASELVSGIAASLGRPLEIKGEGILSRGGLPAYTRGQLKASLLLEEQPSWSDLGYSPQFDLRKVCQEIAAWFTKEPWAVEAS